MHSCYRSAIWRSFCSNFCLPFALFWRYMTKIAKLEANRRVTIKLLQADNVMVNVKPFRFKSFDYEKVFWYKTMEKKTKNANTIRRRLYIACK